ncbi:MAG: MdtA/MuxA family multidrug efflux RND transporter periplasmic adaptor subunit [Acidobacteria bacterium]|nr:MdtA/MuxA family multidrug efflux RND transporter periplasmic adaptor subunit [Acidobacteriota bacterium]MBI3425907.1 MdtA/MuxA family multidrug efflux RND transporter periplasmic adaptor subunit [Acidobacteriota bacterium]
MSANTKSLPQPDLTAAQDEPQRVNGPGAVVTVFRLEPQSAKRLKEVTAAPPAPPPTTAEAPRPAAGQNEALPAAGHQSHTRWWLLLFAVLLASGFWAYQRPPAVSAPLKPARNAVPSVPVTIATARTSDIPVYLNGLGTVTPLNTISVKTRLDGQLTRIDFKEGQFVNKGALLAEIDARPYEVQLAQAQAQLERDQATLNNAKADLARYQYLVGKGIIPQQQVDTQAAVVAQNSAVIKVDETQIDNAKLQLTYCRITAPISGRIGLRQVDPGNMVHAADANGLVVITQVQPIGVLFTIPEDSLSAVLQKFRTGAQLSAEAYDRSGQTKLVAGRLLTMDNQIDPATGTNRLKAVFENKANALFPNQFVNIRLLVETQKDKVLIPAVAIQRGPNGAFVYVVKPDQTVEVRPVTVSTMEGTEAAIDSGLAANEQVVTDGVDKLQAGSKVQIANKEKAGA